MTGKWVSNVSYMRHTSKHKATSQCVCACVSSRRAALWSGIWWCVTHTSKSEQRQMLITHYMSAHTHTRLQKTHHYYFDWQTETLYCSDFLGKSNFNCLHTQSCEVSPLSPACEYNCPYKMSNASENQSLLFSLDLICANQWRHIWEKRYSLLLIICIVWLRNIYYFLKYFSLMDRKILYMYIIPLK